MIIMITVIMMTIVIILSFTTIKIKIWDSQYRNKNFKMKDLKMGTIHHEIRIEKKLRHLCKFDISTKSKSKIPICPTPAPAKVLNYRLRNISIIQDKMLETSSFYYRWYFFLVIKYENNGVSDHLSFL